jgi:serine/threonine protein kinase
MLGGDPQAIDLLEKLIVFDPYKRIEMKEIFEHPFFA